MTTGTYRINILSTGVKAKGEKEYEIVIPEANEGQQLEGLDFELEPNET